MADPSDLYRSLGYPGNDDLHQMLAGDIGRPLTAVEMAIADRLNAVMVALSELLNDLEACSYGHDKDVRAAFEKAIAIGLHD